MSIFRKWFCNCRGEKVEMSYEELLEGEEGEALEPQCAFCGATPSSDPKRTVSYHDFDDSNE